MSSDLSDSDDDDYQPENDVNNKEVSDLSEEDIESFDETDNGKRKRTSKDETASSKKIRNKSESNQVNSEENNSENASKEKSDELWASFLEDSNISKAEKSDLKYQPEEICSKIDANKIEESFNFAGEEVIVTKKIEISTDISSKDTLKFQTGTNLKQTSNIILKKPCGRGLNSVLSQLGKSKKLSTLEKSKLDWDSFKKGEGINEEIQTHNKGRDGYIFQHLYFNFLVFTHYRSNFLDFWSARIFFKERILSSTI